MIHKYIEKIVENNRQEDMQELSEILEDVMYKLKDYNEKCFHKYKTKLYEMAYGKVLNMDMAEDWVESMNPPAKWTFEETSAVKRQYGLQDISDIDFYVVMNMLYSDMHEMYGEDVDRYVRATKLWLNDPDAKEGKLYNYRKYIVD